MRHFGNWEYTQLVVDRGIVLLFVCSFILFNIYHGMARSKAKRTIPDKVSEDKQ